MIIILAAAARYEQNGGLSNREKDINLIPACVL